MAIVAALIGALGIRLLEAKLDAHHELGPARAVGGDRRDHVVERDAGEAIAGEDLPHLVDLDVALGVDLVLLAGLLRGEMLDVGARSEEAAETHGDGARRDFREPGRDDDGGARYRGREPRGERERHREAVRHADHHVAHGFGGHEMLFDMGERWASETFEVGWRRRREPDRGSAR